MNTKFILDSGDPREFREIAKLATEKGSELWGATTNPSLIAKTAVERLEGKKLTQNEAFDLQKELTLEILEIVPGAVSAEVYADDKTTAGEMIEQGSAIATWGQRVVVKLPTTLEGFRARTALRKNGSVINNTLVFSQEQIFAICLHEHILQTTENVKEGTWPCFISPFVGRLDDIGQNGMDLVRNGMNVKATLSTPLWMLEASIRNLTHMQEGLDLGTELMTAPAKVYRDWFENPNNKTQTEKPLLQSIQSWKPPEELLSLNSLSGFMEAIETGVLDITHELTDKGIERFADDWKALLIL